MAMETAVIGSTVDGKFHIITYHHITSYDHNMNHINMFTFFNRLLFQCEL